MKTVNWSAHQDNATTYLKKIFFCILLLLEKQELDQHSEYRMSRLHNYTKMLRKETATLALLRGLCSIRNADFEITASSWVYEILQKLVT